jgi:hypothetical protein
VSETRNWPRRLATYRIEGRMKVEEGKLTGTVGALPARSDSAIAVALFVVALALRVPFRSQFAYH